MKLSHGEVRGLTALIIILSLVLLAMWLSGKREPATPTPAIIAAEQAVDHPDTLVTDTLAKPRTSRKSGKKSAAKPKFTPDRQSPHTEQVQPIEQL